MRQPPADFLDQVEQARVSSGTIALWYTGGAGYIVKTPKSTIYIDPFCGPSIDEEGRWTRMIAPPFDPSKVGTCDLILSTHEHLDHCDPKTLGPMLASTGATLAGPSSSTATAAGFGWPSDRLRALTWRQSMVVGDVRITAVKSVDPMAKGCNGYVLESEGVTFVNMGDSLWFDDIGKNLAAWSVDAIAVSVAQNPVGETYYMSEVDAARIARDVGARQLIPHHWDLWQWVAMDPARVQTVTPWVAPGCVVRPAQYCQRMDVSRRA